MGEFFVYSFFFGTLLFLFPIFVDADLYLDACENRGWFSISLYHRLRLFGGVCGSARRRPCIPPLEKKGRHPSVWRNVEREKEI